eukprot:scpid74394/ scgid13645/ Retrotransposable element Tf2 155 kDa protein type 1
MVNYLSRFVPNFTDVMQPLQNLLQKDMPFVWSDTQQCAFKTIKQMLSTTPGLAFFDPNKKIILENDASEYGLGSVLMQDDRPIAFASRSLKPAERNYAQIEK